MRIGIDAHSWGRNQTGNETYTVNLVKNLAEVDRDNNYRLYIIEKTILNNPLFERANFQARLIKPANRWTRVLFSLPFELIKDRVDIVHTQYFPPLIYPSKFVVTVHDISFKRFPQCFSQKERFMFQFVKLAMERARRIITVSEFTKKEILGGYNLSQDKVIVVHNGIRNMFRPIRDTNLIQKAKKKYSLPEDFILYVGSFSLRKNIPGLLRAFKIFKKTTGRKEKLVLAGRKSCRYNKIDKLIEELKIKEEVKFTGYIPENDLPAIYNCSNLFVSLSFYEGFCLPALEAMACATPAVTSNTSVFPEVMGGAGVMVDPYDEEAAAKAMAEILEDRGLYREMSLRALNQAKKFSWLETAKKTLEVYKQAYKGVGR